MESVSLEELDLEGADADWFEANFTGRAASDGPRFGEPVEVKIDALLGKPLVRHASDLLSHALEHLAAVRAQHEVMLVNVLAELVARGEEPPGGLRVTDWLRTLDPGLTAGAAKDLVTVARAVTQPRWSELASRVTMQHVTVAKAARIIEFQERNERVADPAEMTSAVQDLVTRAPDLIHEDFTALVRQHTEQVRPPRDEERLDEGRRASRGLWFGAPSRSGMVPMRAVLDPEAAAVIKSALDPLATPCPSTDGYGRTVAADPRTPAKRRADALLQVIERGVTAGEHLPTTDKAKVVVTIDHDVLAGTVRGAGLAMSGDVLSSSTVRRLACDAAIIPMVLGTRGEPLDVGRERRLVTKGLRLALWQRDGGCSFPGCTIAPQWTDAHHVQHWSAGGRTSLLNLALLCRRHHTHVHRHDLSATVTTTSATWRE
ncbi:HNH endonuclease [Intrasporangium calvum]|uniref:HNH endonuclease n=1 Tax=Intrasporangium calvum TaxID=53358 RepID=A0ABT5GDX6_9MICO|nr:HNH endonuclease signature motif containing protein [Intrasporangium calvum]MDC5696442.1 HNH endonuclease [Intrasporangium calvum]